MEQRQRQGGYQRGEGGGGGGEGEGSSPSFQGCNYLGGICVDTGVDIGPIAMALVELSGGGRP